MSVPGEAPRDLGQPSHHCLDQHRRRALLVLLTGFALTAGAGIVSEGLYHEDDLKHFLFARWSEYDGRYLLDPWGRPGFTVPYALPAMLGSPQTGWHACRLLSAGLTAATAWLAYLIARHLRLRHAWLAVALVYLQPLLTHLSLTTLTETPLAFYLALATWLLARDRTVASACVIALAPVTRSEAIVLLPVWAVALWRARAHWASYPLMLWAIVLHNLAAAPFLDALPAMRYLQPAGSGQYGQGTALSFVPRLLFAAGPVVVALAIVGTRLLGVHPRTLKTHRRDAGATRVLGYVPSRRRHGWLLAAAPGAYFLVETIVYMRGAYASGGYARFLVPIAPWLAVLATAGLQPLMLTRRPAIRMRGFVAAGLTLAALGALCELEWLIRPPTVRPPWQTSVLIGRIVLLCYLVTLLIALLRLRPSGRTAPTLVARSFTGITGSILLLGPILWAIAPLRLLPQHEIMRDAVPVIQPGPGCDRPLLAVNYWLYYWADRPVPQDIPPWYQALEDAAPGTLFAWDARFCLDPDLNFPLSRMDARPEWHRVWESPPDAGSEGPFLVLFEKRVLASSPGDS